MISTGAPGEYYGVQGMTWRDPPLLANPDRVREHRTAASCCSSTTARSCAQVGVEDADAPRTGSPTRSTARSRTRACSRSPRRCASELRSAARDSRRRAGLRGPDAALARSPACSPLLILAAPPPRPRARAPIPCPYSASGVVGQRAGGVLRFPQASAVGPDGSVYVADQYSHAIQVFGPDGTFRRELGAGAGPGRADARSARVAVAARRLGLRRRRRRPDRPLRRRRLAAEARGARAATAPGQFHFGAGGGNDSGAGGGIASGRTARSTSPTRATTGSSASPPTARSPVVIVPQGPAVSARRGSR